MTNHSHVTTRRAFIATAGFGGVSLYGLWAAYGAAPNPLTLLGPGSANSAGHGVNHGDAALEAPPQAPDQGAHATHGGASVAGPDAEEFSRMTAQFSERYRLPDGRVYPRRLPAGTPHQEDPHAGHSGAAMGEQVRAHAPLAGHQDTAADPALMPGAHEPMQVLMMAGKWYYLPQALRLDAGQAYRFRMMVSDIAHGASIQFGKGARMMRLQPGRLTETELTFTKPGHYLMHCTVYCGEAHDVMQATIEVV